MMVLAYDHMTATRAGARPDSHLRWRGLALRRATRLDLPAVCDLLCAAYGEPRYHPEGLQRYLSVQGALLWLAAVRGRPVGVAGVVRYGNVARIGVVGVHPIAQGAGVAHMLMTHLLHDVDDTGCVCVTLDATPAAVALYTGLGFVHAGRTVRFVRGVAALAPTVAPEVDVSVMADDDVLDVTLFDAPLFGVTRSAALRTFVAADKGRAFVARDKAGRIAGYLIATRHGLGPWVARTRATAAALLAAALTLPFATPPTVVLPAENGAAVALLDQYGFQFERANTFMWRGGTPVGQRTAIYGQASFALG